MNIHIIIYIELRDIQVAMGYIWLEGESRALKYTCQIKTRSHNIQRQSYLAK